MRKVMLLAAMLAMVLAAAVPAFAQNTTTNDINVVDVENNAINSNICQQILNGDVSGTAAQYQYCAQVAQNTGNIAGVQGNEGGENVAVVEGEEEGTETVVAVVEGEEEGTETVVAAAEEATGGVLPETGGASLLALGAGTLLVAGGLVARRIVR